TMPRRLRPGENHQRTLRFATNLIYCLLKFGPAVYGIRGKLDARRQRLFHIRKKSLTIVGGIVNHSNMYGVWRDLPYQLRIFRCDPIFMHGKARAVATGPSQARDVASRHWVRHLYKNGW